MNKWLCALLLAVAAKPVSAQQSARRFAAPSDSAAVHARWTPVRIAKWSTLLAGTGAVAYGFVENHGADRDYADIEQVCKTDASRCDRTSATGPYTDATLEARYQSVVQRDARARDALLIGQVGIAVSAVLFVIDLPKSTGPQNIPYEPHSLRVGTRNRQLIVGWTLAVH